VLRAENRAEKSTKRALGANNGFLSYAIQRSFRVLSFARIQRVSASFVAATRREKLEFRLRAAATQAVARQIKTAREGREARFFGGQRFFADNETLCNGSST